MVERVFAPGVMPRALEAARECDVRPVYNKSLLQQRLADALVDFMPQLWRPHPRNVDRARAAAEVIVAEVPPWVERQAFELASRHQHMTESECRKKRHTSAKLRSSAIGDGRRGKRYILADCRPYLTLFVRFVGRPTILMQQWVVNGTKRQATR